MSTKISSSLSQDTLSDVYDRTRSAMAVSQVAARLSFLSSIASLAFLAVLHLLSPEFNPSSRMVSEYALGSHGWALFLMFMTWALSCIALFFAIKSELTNLGGKIGLCFLLLAAVGMMMGGLFDVNHNLHGLAAMIGIPSLPIAAVLIGVSLSRNPSWASARRFLIGTAILTWASLILMNVAIFTGFSPTGEANPGAWFGWANRFLIVAYDIWLLVVVWRAPHIWQARSS